MERADNKPTPEAKISVEQTQLLDFLTDESVKPLLNIAAIERAAGLKEYRVKNAMRFRNVALTAEEIGLVWQVLDKLTVRPPSAEKQPARPVTHP